MSALPEPALEAAPPTPPEKPKPRRATYLWPWAIGSFVLGLLFLVGWRMALVPSGWVTAIALCLLGLLLFGVSFIPLPDVPQKENPLSLVEKVTGIFFEPSRVFRNLREHPNWIGAFIIIGVLSAIYSYAFVTRITPEQIIEHARRQAAEAGTLGGPSEQREAMLSAQLEAMKNPVSRAAGGLIAFTITFVLVAIIASVSMLGMLAFGGRIHFWQSLAVTMYVWLPITVISKVLGIVILYLKSPDDLHPNLNRDTTLQDNLGILVSAADHPVLFVLLSAIGLISFYTLWLRAKGLYLGATKASSGAGWGVSIIVWLIWLFLGITFAILRPGTFA